MNLTTQDAQVECFGNVARHLEPGGCFVIEVIIPELQRLPPGETVRAFTVTPRHLGFDEYDIAAQGVISHHYWVDGGELETFSAPFRYVWPSELDLMARLAGMTLRERWSDWNRDPFTSDSMSHISVWQNRPSGVRPALTNRGPFGGLPSQRSLFGRGSACAAATSGCSRLSRQYMGEPITMASQKVIARYTSTAVSAWVLGTPTATSAPVSATSTTPRPPGVTLRLAPPAPAAQASTMPHHGT